MHLYDHNKIKLEISNRKNSEKSPNNTTLKMHNSKRTKRDITYLKCMKMKYSIKTCGIHVRLCTKHLYYKRRKVWNQWPQLPWLAGKLSDLYKLYTEFLYTWIIFLWILFFEIITLGLFWWLVMMNRPHPFFSSFTPQVGISPLPPLASPWKLEQKPFQTQETETHGKGHLDQFPV